MKCGAETTEKKAKGRDGTSRTTALTDTAAPGSGGQLEERAWKVEQVKKSPKCPAE